MILLGYTRLSTAGQEDGYGQVVQTETIQRWAAEHGHTLLRIEHDTLSGSVPAPDRPALASVLRSAASGEVAGVLIPKLDRLARMLHVQEATLALLWQTGVSVFTVDNGEVLADDASDPARTALRQMMGVFAQLERATIVARMAAGRTAKRRAGGYAGGAPPYGYSASGGTLVPNRREQAALARARELRAMGLSLRGVGESLEMEGHLPRRAARWHAKVVRDLVGSGV